MDGDRLDRGQDRLQRGNPAEVAASARTRRGASGRHDERGAGPVEGARAGEPGAAPGERDPAEGVGVFCPGGARPPVQAMIAFIDEHRAVHEVEPICRVLPIAPSTYHAHAARRADPGKLPARARRDITLRTEIRRVYEENFRVYGVRKVWRRHCQLEPGGTLLLKS